MRDTVRAIVDAAGYRRSIRTSLVERLWLWFSNLLDRMFDAVGALPHGRTIALVAVGVIVVLVAGRIVLASRLGVDDLDADGERRGGARARSLADADRLAAEGSYLDAVHALYRVVLETLARRHGIRLHASKTSGDYVRELRRRGSSAHQPFRQFTRRHDRIVFGFATCDAQGWAMLRADADRVLCMERAA